MGGKAWQYTSCLKEKSCTRLTRLLVPVPVRRAEIAQDSECCLKAADKLGLPRELADVFKQLTSLRCSARAPLSLCGNFQSWRAAAGGMPEVWGEDIGTFPCLFYFSYQKKKKLELTFTGKLHKENTNGTRLRKIALMLIGSLNCFGLDL